MRETPCRRSPAFWKLWLPSGLLSARMRKAAAPLLLVLICALTQRVLCSKLGGQPDNPVVASADKPSPGDAGRH